jgi:kynurenine formamidase
MSPVHLMSSDGGDYAALGRDDWGTASDYLFLASGATTHIDALSHVWSGGAERDVPSGQISSLDIDTWFREYGLESNPGDALIFRTGWMDDALACAAADSAGR